MLFGRGIGYALVSSTKREELSGGTDPILSTVDDE